jgi:hypothetical protein
MATYRSLANLATQTQEALFPALIDVLKVQDEALDMLIADALVTDRLTIKFARAADEGTAGYVACDDAITTSATSANSVSYDLRTINKSFSVCLPGQDLGASFVDPTEIEMQSAMKAIGKLIGDDAINGVYASNEIAGLNEQVVTTVAAASASDLLPKLDEAYDVTLSRGNLAWIMAPAAARAVELDLRSAAGGLTYDVLAGTTRNVPQYRGIPIVRSAWVPANTGYLVDREQFKLVFGASENAGAGIFNFADAGVMESRLRKIMHVYVNVQAALFNTQGATKITGLV